MMLAYTGTDFKVIVHLKNNICYMITYTVSEEQTKM